MRGHKTSLKCRERLNHNTTYINDQLNSLLEEEFATLIPADLTNQRILYSIRQYEGNNMPGFPSINSFYFLIDPLLRKLKHPLLHCLDEVTTLLSRTAEEIML